MVVFLRVPDQSRGALPKIVTVTGSTAEKSGPVVRECRVAMTVYGGEDGRLTAAAITTTEPGGTPGTVSALPARMRDREAGEIKKGGHGDRQAIAMAAGYCKVPGRRSPSEDRRV